MSKKMINNCCAFEDEIKKLGKVKINKKYKRRIKTGNFGDDECDDIDDDDVKINEKSIFGLSGKCRDYAEFNFVERIKPGISTRDEYSLSRHAQCVNDPSMNLKNNNQSTTLWHGITKR
ncbi:hypothetical protein HCN44_003278 [Aphidius gifuensis]|uniref:Uncharacterized protein n=1 Tax=Aphidius gifuensis TaxID=684658 RepID=A0A834XK79_APHGI|nr:hypothetical protein HCN44_003278 [Aphidius gifuensis]